MLMPADSLGSTEALIINYLQWWLEHREVTELEKTKKEEIYLQLSLEVNSTLAKCIRSGRLG